LIITPLFIIDAAIIDYFRIIAITLTLLISIIDIDIAIIDIHY
jgi:hypothetical protein